MEAIIAIVGFLGAGKTTLLRRLISSYIEKDWAPYVVLNDYENAFLDAQELMDQVLADRVKPLNGSCICCSGIADLRDFVNAIPERINGITLIEANGTSDAVSLMGFLGVGIDERFLPPVQVSVVDVNNWQERGEHNELEANQVQVASLIVLTHTDKATGQRCAEVVAELNALNPSARISSFEELDISLLPGLSPCANDGQGFDHDKAHWASCSIDLPDLPDETAIHDICAALPESILRVKGCASVGEGKGYTYFERLPDGEVLVRPYNGIPVTGTRLLSVGPGSQRSLLRSVVADALMAAEPRNKR